jgi:hypothetical protein
LKAQIFLRILTLALTRPDSLIGHKLFLSLFGKMPPGSLKAASLGCVDTRPYTGCSSRDRGQYHRCTSQSHCSDDIYISQKAASPFGDTFFGARFFSFAHVSIMTQPNN